MKKKYYLLTLVLVSIVLLIIGYNITKDFFREDVFKAEKINLEADVKSKTRAAIELLCQENGVYLFNTGKLDETYFILDGTHVDLNGKAPSFSDVKIETLEDTIMIYFNEELKNYSIATSSEQKLVYKIIKDKNYNYIKLFKNGEETYFDEIGG
jgi:hypothetical protein